MANILSRRSKTKGNANSPRECLFPTCNNKSRRRGLCDYHKKEATKALKAGLASESNLIRRNLLTVDKTTKKVKKKVRKPKATAKASGVKKMLCLVKQCPSLRYKRGLCKSHLKQALKELSDTKNDSQRKKLEKSLIQRKLLLPEVQESIFSLKSKTQGSLQRRPR